LQTHGLVDIFAQEEKMKVEMLNTYINLS